MQSVLPVAISMAITAAFIFITGFANFFSPAYPQLVLVIAAISALAAFISFLFWAASFCAIYDAMQGRAGITILSHLSNRFITYIGFIIIYNIGKLIFAGIPLLLYMGVSQLFPGSIITTIIFIILAIITLILLFLFDVILINFFSSTAVEFTGAVDSFKNSVRTALRYPIETTALLLALAIGVSILLVIPCMGWLALLAFLPIQITAMLNFYIATKERR